MVNSEAFANRLQKILTYYELTASSFAERIDVGRASISHILSGRNKPSLDFVMKIVKEFSEVELYWLINGKGHFPKSTPVSPPTEKAHSKKEEISVSQKTTSQKVMSSVNGSAEISKVIIFYKDGRFEVFDTQN
ncbi:MAG: helix-turn-helix domain-containing protein [Psychroflexus sp.]|nr:helix-turn-helix domain-containing protein [Psychroflexus sp.]MDN6316463.1 helix-turn-helix domain-containing protein [Lactococcus lactis]